MGRRLGPRGSVTSTFLHWPGTDDDGRRTKGCVRYIGGVEHFRSPHRLWRRAIAADAGESNPRPGAERAVSKAALEVLAHPCATSTEQGTWLWCNPPGSLPRAAADKACCVSLSIKGAAMGHDDDRTPRDDVTFKRKKLPRANTGPDKLELLAEAVGENQSPGPATDRCRRPRPRPGGLRR